MLFLINLSFLQAEDKKIEFKGPLKDLPSKEGSHIGKIKKMKDNTWLNLGSPKADPKWGKNKWE
jgi:hypothetical protein